ncbi:hypothetical protein [Salinarimonas sp.]|uniref:hypothetical protein n=1 Tax=Salinarimonas sp. TaxID=2766526 RepID=UPI00391B67D4
MASEARKIVEDVLTSHVTRLVWTSAYAPVFPFTPQGYSVGAVLPILLYLFRWGHRRGKGRVQKAFGDSGKPTIATVAARLAKEPTVAGFDSRVGQTILGDLLLCSTLENKRHAEGHDEQVQRCFPNHYMASWLDLPYDTSAVRNVPDSIVALIAKQEGGERIEPQKVRGRYPVGARVEDNAFLRAFAPGIVAIGEQQSNVRSDRFDEDVDVGLDQLLTVRLAQICGEPPAKASGKGEPGPISNQRSIAQAASAAFREDLLTFFDAYGSAGTVPRAALLSMIESAIALGMTTIGLATVAIVNKWAETGEIAPTEAQQPYPLFVDCSGSTDSQLRGYSEQSSLIMRQATARVPATLMYMRLLDYYLEYESDVPRAQQPPRGPDGSARVRLLGDIASGRHEEARDAEKYFRSLARKLADAAREQESSAIRADILEDEEDGRTHGRRLAEVLHLAYASVAGGDKLNQFVNASLMADEPNGLARKRRVDFRRAPSLGQTRTGEVYSFQLSNTVLDYLVHRHLWKSTKRGKLDDLSFPRFLSLLRERYGLFVDRSPPDVEVPSELLHRNRAILERRLRDLGLLVGVNDAETMKKLRARYVAPAHGQATVGDDKVGDAA